MVSSMPLPDPTSEPEKVPRHLKRPLGWPAPLAPEAYYGLVGDVVRAMEPHTEADPASLLLGFHAAFGNALGRTAYGAAEEDKHHTNIYVGIVGESSKARKGTSWGRIQSLFKMVDPNWVANRIQPGGLSSGEGLIHKLRDSDTAPGPEAKVAAGLVPMSPGTFIRDADRRLFVIDSEFASTLKMMSREGNTLSPVIRQAWDGLALGILTKTSPARATDTHVSMIAHVTRQELIRFLKSTDMANGFANRYLWVCTARSKVLPEGGGSPDLTLLVPRIQSALTTGMSFHEVPRDEEARRAWAEVYPDLSEGKPGLLGAVTARAEAQVLRLSVLYAVEDGSPVVKLPHLRAALAVWQYAEDSARYIFGDRSGDEVAARILEGLRTHGEMSRTDISRLLDHNVPKVRIDEALSLLEGSGLAAMESRKTGGIRPTEVWKPTNGEATDPS